MECKKCKSKWESQLGTSKSMTNCPFCGASLNDNETMIKEGPFDTSKEALIYIAKKHGVETLLGNLKDIFPDYAPFVSKQKKGLVLAVNQHGSAKILQDNIASKQADKEIAFKKAVEKLTDAYIAEQAATTIILEFTQALGWNITPPAADVHVPESKKGVAIDIPKSGEIHDGIIASVSDNRILVSIGSKFEGVIEGEEFDAIPEEFLWTLKEGNAIPVYVVNPENHDGNIILSFIRAVEELSWIEAEELLKSGESFPSTVIGYQEGGLIVPLMLIHGFIPNSQLSLRHRFNISGGTPEEKFKEFVGEAIDVCVIEVDHQRQRLILSERAASDETRDPQHPTPKPQPRPQIPTPKPQLKPQPESVSLRFVRQTILNQLIAKSTSSSVIGNEILGGKRSGLKFGTLSGKPIFWRVLDVQDNRVLLLSEDVTHVGMQYDKNYVSVNWKWETCKLREWLNKDFLKTFSSQEQALITFTTNTNESYNLRGDRVDEKQTQDRIFLLSYFEVVKYFGEYGRLGYDDKSKSARMAKHDGSMAWWWLRSPGYLVWIDGAVFKRGTDVNKNGLNFGGVRPALWLNLRS